MEAWCPARSRALFPGFVDPYRLTLREAAPLGTRWMHEIKFDDCRPPAHLDHDLQAQISDRTRSMTAALNLGRRARRRR